jgi:SAM-dependent methyltransferase
VQLVRALHDVGMPADEGYLLDNRQDEAGQRFAALATLFDESTFRHLTALGLRPSWRVWEVGAGGPSVPDWLAQRTAPDGEVLATDLDTAWIAGPRPRPNLSVLRHDVGLDPPPDGPFDLVHARLVLVHVPQREKALAAMVSVLAPGGWLVLEDADPALQPLLCLEESGSAQQLANRLKAGFRQLMADRGVDLAFGRTLPRRLREAGLVDVGADAFFPITGPACVDLERATTRQIREQLVAAGLATADEIEQHLGNLSTDLLDLATSPMITAWGRRPSPWSPTHHTDDGGTQ